MKRNNVSQFLYLVFRKDIGRKLMALILALILWVFLDQKVVTREPHNLAVRVVYGESAFVDQSTSSTTEAFFIEIPEQLILTEDLVDRNLEVTLSAPKEMLQFRLLGHRKITMNEMQGLDKRRITLNLSREYFDALKKESAKSVIVDFRPRQLYMNIAVRATAEIVLSQENVAFIGVEELNARGFEIESVTFDPNTIKIEGPAPVIDEIDADHSLLGLESMELSNTAKSQHLRLSQAMRDNNVSFQGANQSVKVNVNLTEERGERVVEKEVLVFFRGRPLEPEEYARIELVPQKVKVKFTGPKSQIDTLDTLDEKLKSKVWPMVDLEDFGASLTLEQIIADKLNQPVNVRIMKDRLFRPEIRIETDEVDRSIKVNKKE